MLTLLLLRHAKSSWDDPELEDKERPLSKRGAKAAPLMGRYMVREGLIPDVVLCSSAHRTRATLMLLLSEFRGAPPPIDIRDDLYLAEPRALLQRLHALGRDYETVLVVGHNPGLHALALELTGGGDRALIGALAREFPTAALAGLTFEGQDWSQVGAATGRLRHFMTPRRLAAAGRGR